MSHLLWYTYSINKMRNEMKTFKIETEDRYGRFNDYEIQAESLELATAVAKSANHYISDVSEVQESTQKIEDNFSDMMPTAEEFWYDAQPEAYEPSCYDGTYSEM